jgi:DNA repair photolyase
MIISASRRTDIPSFYSEWFFNRIKEGFLYVRNPMNIYQVSKIKLTPDVVDFIVFWTKNPAPMIDRLDELKDYPSYFQFTVTSYGQDIETNVPSKEKVIIPAFKKLSDKIGKEKVIWRYDPILLNSKYTKEYHYENFEKAAKELSSYTEKCTISFLDFYAKTERNLKGETVQSFTNSDYDDLAKNLSNIAKSYNLKIDTCAEMIDLNKYGIDHAHCIDADLIERISNYKFKLSKDKNQRKECGCVESIDIGAYNTCKNGCKYCYANFNQIQVNENYLKHNPDSPFLFGELDTAKDKITERKMKSLKISKNTNQLTFGI